jgi:hypothetical protein
LEVVYSSSLRIVRYMGLSRPVRLTDKANDIYSDYLEILVGLRYDATKIKWRLDNTAKFTEY